MVINQKNVKLLREAYEKAVAEKKDKFTFQDEEFAVTYAKFMLQWLEEQVIITK
tara:strand:+ start:987 stop:1148 length:162 start_codon:yes stop_codon:yes gene_type:complete